MIPKRGHSASLSVAKVSLKDASRC
jgi:hypothetical protein